MDLHGFSPRLIAQLTGVSLKTAQRWKRAGRAPPIAAKLMELTAHADLGSLAPSWRGFRLVAGMLWTPENYQLTPGDLRAIPYRTQQLRDLEKEIARPRQFVLL
jgi:Phage protein